MEKEVTILIAEDDEGHALLIKKNLKRAGITNDIMHFNDGDGVLNFLFKKEEYSNRKSKGAYLLLLDISMPRVNGTDVLKEIKKDKTLRKMPVIMITTTDDPREIDACHNLGCNNYITKPVDYEQFVNVIMHLGLFIKIVQIPMLSEC